MVIKKIMGEAEKKLFKEKVIKEYKLKHLEIGRRIISEEFLGKLKALAPFEIAIGIIAAVALIYISGIKTFVILMLYGIVWLTLVTSIASLFIKTK